MISKRHFQILALSAAAATAVMLYRFFTFPLLNFASAARVGDLLAQFFAFFIKLYAYGIVVSFVGFTFYFIARFELLKVFGLFLFAAFFICFMRLSDPRHLYYAYAFGPGAALLLKYLKKPLSQIQETYSPLVAKRLN